MLRCGLNIRHNNFQNNIIDFWLYYKKTKERNRSRKKIFKILLLRLVLAVLCVLCLYVKQFLICPIIKGYS